MTWKYKFPTPWKRLLAALLLVAAASALGVAFFGSLGEQIPHLLYFPAVTLAALHGGLLAGLLATVLSSCFILFWIKQGHLTPPEWLALVVFIISGALISVICETMHRGLKRERLVGKEAVLEKEKLQRAMDARQQSDASLVASELRYRRLFEAARDGVLILDAETGMVVDVNPYLIELLGVTREVFLGKRVWELGFFNDLIANEANFTELQEKKYIRYEDMALKGHDGKRHEVEFISNVYLVEGHKVIQCNIRDITERKQAEDELSETKAFLHAALNQSQVGIAIADAPSGRLRFVNQAGLLIGGGTEVELVTDLDVNQYAALWKLFDLDGTPLATDAVPLARAVLFGEHCTREFIIRSSELGDRIVLANAAPIRNPAGKVTAGIVVFLDITERKRVEELLRQNTQELRDRNEELTRFNRLATGRELRTIELKQQVNELAAQLGQLRPYPLAFLDAAAAEVVRTTPKPDEQGAEVSDQKSEVSKTQKEKSP